MKRAIISLLSVAAVMASCNKSQTELPPTSTPTSKSLTVEKARSFYDALQGHVTKSDISEDSLFVPINYTPQWNYAAQSANMILEAVEVPIASKKSYVAVIDNQTVAVEQRLLAVDGTKFKGITGYMMTIIPKGDYFKSHSDYLSRITHAGNKYGFTGHILFHTIWGNLVAIDTYNGGMVVSHLYIPEITDSNLTDVIRVYEQVMSGVKIYHLKTTTTKSINSYDDKDGGEIDPVIVIGGSTNYQNWLKWLSNDMLQDYMDSGFYVDPSAYEGEGGSIPDIPWPEGIHNSIISVALRQLTMAQISLIQVGSYEADKLQGVQYNHIHAQRSAQEDIIQAVRKTKTYFSMEAMQFVKNKDYVALGKALHSIMDAYSPPHEGFSVYNDYTYMIRHWSEINADISRLLYTPQISNSIGALEFVFSGLNELSTNATYIDIDNIFYSWLGGYVNYLDGE